MAARNDERCMSCEEFAKLFNLSDADYAAQVPSWIRSVPRCEVSMTNADLLKQLQQASKTNRRLEQVLQASGVPVPQDIPYAEAKAKVEELTMQLGEIADSREYQRISMELEKYTASLMASDEYQEELRRQEQVWENENSEENRLALMKLRRHIPVNVRYLSEDQLTEQYGLPKPIARKIKRTTILELIRKKPEDLERMHPSMLEGFRTAGLTLTERRALYEHMKPLGIKWAKAKDPMTERKLQFFNLLKAKLKEMTSAWAYHVQTNGQPCASHKCNLLGNQCPFKADAAVNYSGDYGCYSSSGPHYEDNEAPVVAPAPVTPKKSNGSTSAQSPARPSPAAFLGDITKKQSSSPSNTPPRQSLLAELSNPKLKTTKKPAGGLSNSLLSEISGAKLKKASSPLEPPKTPKRNLLTEIKKRDHIVTNERLPPKPTPSRKQLFLEIQKPDLNKLKAPVSPNKSKENKKETVTPTKTKKSKIVVARGKSDSRKSACEDNGQPEKTPEERKNERIAILDRHYAGKARDTKEANRHCDMLESAMDLLDQSMDKWVANMVKHGDQQTDEQKKEQAKTWHETVCDLEPVVVSLKERTRWVERSTIECRLAEDFYGLAAITFNFIRSRAKTLDVSDKSSKKKRKELIDSLDFVHGKNLKRLEELHCEPYPTRKLKTVKQRLVAAMSAKKTRKVRKVKRTKSGRDLVVEASAPEEPESPRTASEAPVELSVAEISGRDQLKWALQRQVEEAQRTQRKLEKAIANAGLTIPDEEITYQVAKNRIAEISKQLTTMDHKDPTYFGLEQEMEKYSSALIASDEYQEELRQKEKQWENDVLDDNIKAVKILRRHMPVNIRNMSEAELSSTKTPNRKTLPLALAKRFKRTSVLQFIRVDPRDIEKMHFADLEGTSLSALTLTECRALYEHLKGVGARWEKQKSDKSVERKYMWFMMVRNKLKMGLDKYEKHVREYGPPGRHKCTAIGNQCPVKIEESVDYSGDYGFTADAVYETLDVTREDLDNLAEKAKEDAQKAIEERKQYWNSRT